MRATLRDRVRVRFNFRCGYCGVQEDEAGARLTIDHYQPRAHGGTDDEENCVYCCHACNEFKGDYWVNEETLRVLHPLRDDLSLYYVERIDHRFVGLNDRGRLHITLLRLNREAQIAARRRRHTISLNTGRFEEMQHQFGVMQSDISTRLKIR